MGSNPSRHGQDRMSLFVSKSSSSYFRHSNDIIRGFAFKGFTRAKGTVVGDQVINKFFQLSIDHLDDEAASFESKELVTFLARRILKGVRNTCY